ncbi:MAG: hypothetical protein PW735_08515 [Acidobacteriaceae bacterium]|nr:hypothetical protein [Acidobacteriaceae bacterium]
MMFYSREMKPLRLEPLRQDEFEARIVAALEHQVEAPALPEDFSARVVAALPASLPRRSRWRAARTFSILSGVVLLAVMLWCAPRSVAGLQSPAFFVECAATAALAVLSAMVARFWRHI